MFGFNNYRKKYLFKAIHITKIVSETLGPCRKVDHGQSRVTSQTLDLRARKPFCGVSDEVGFKPACSATEIS